MGAWWWWWGGGAAAWLPLERTTPTCFLGIGNGCTRRLQVMLYESDLDDNGVCQLSVKMRVMPKCWLVLLRMWMRVDGSTVRLRESRMFCR